MDEVVECVCNFSEGRREQIVGSIIAAMRSTGDASILDVTSDSRRDWTLVTLAGPPGAAEEVAYAGIERAAELVSMADHRGCDRRLGATDSVVIAPLEGVTGAKCAEIAQRLASRVGLELGIPVYLHELAAQSPDRVALSHIRSIGYEGLIEGISSDPRCAPDYGPKKVGSAGVTAVGAVEAVIGLEVYLGTEDLEVAKQVARAVAYSSGGLRYVRAVGNLEEGQTKVAMTVVDFVKSPLHRVLTLIRSEAARYDAPVTRCEFVGLVPQEALLEAAAWHLQVELDRDQVLENRLTRVRPPTPFLDAVAADTPAPGGGSVAALAGAAASALTTMVARLTLGRKQYYASEETMKEIIERAEQLRAALTARISEDADAYTEVIAAYRLPGVSEREQRSRQTAIQRALAHAAEVPLSTARDAVTTIKLARKAAQLGNVNALTDAATAAHMAAAAVNSAVLNVRVNASLVTDRERASAWLSEIEHLRQVSHDALMETLELVQKRSE